ncbi:MAG: proton-conducting transporter membrane subunit [Victivallaceae bacterium]|jgi:formate hydrogenlyase subunit 3/multisubunit Na+/H+ antiporter MnhD subunit
MNLFFIGIAIYLLTAVLSMMVNESRKGLVTACGSLLGGVTILIPCVRILLSGEAYPLSFMANYPVGQVRLLLDPFAAFFVMVIALGSIFCAMYGSGYMKQYHGKGKAVSAHFFFLICLFVAMLLLPVIRNAIVFLIVWEIMSLSSFFLVIFESEKKEVFDAGIFYLIMMHVSVILLTVGFLVLIRLAGSADFADFHDFFQSGTYRPASDTAFILLAAGFGIKAGFLPLHSWLPEAHPAAPSHVSGLMSGVMIKLGIFGILLMIMVLGVPSLWVCYTFTAVAVLSALAGIFYASAQDDIKRALAYSSVENIGIIGIGIGVAMLGMAYKSPVTAMIGLSGALIHLFNHSLFKGLLFYGAGAVYMQTHTRNLNFLGGLFKQMPKTGTAFLIGSLAICGLPPFNGFIGKFIIYYSMLNCKGINGESLLIAAIASFALLAFVGAVSVICFTRLFSTVFMGAPRDKHAEGAVEVPFAMTFPMTLMAALCLAGGVLPLVLLRITEHPAAVITGVKNIPGIAAEFHDPLYVISMVFIALVLLTILLFALRLKLLRRQPAAVAGTWGCGYDNPTSRIQYTAASFSMPFLDVIKPVMQRKDNTVGVKGLFPLKAVFEFKIKDVFETAIIRPLGQGTVFLLTGFSWIQNGRMQYYLFYGIVFLVLSLIWIIFW